MRLSVQVETDGHACDENCAFLEEAYCLLFNKTLNYTVLPNGYEWQDGDIQTSQRHYRCITATIEKEILP